MIEADSALAIDTIWVSNLTFAQVSIRCPFVSALIFSNGSFLVIAQTIWWRHRALWPLTVIAIRM
jgi:hypothetical protein